ncbi:BTAD domain-containing putative transcriptional regulator [Gordonia sp. NPDC003376]
MRNRTPIIQRKIQPPTTTGQIVRNRLERRIVGAVANGGVVPVVGFAGSGKTCAVAAALADHPHLAWLTLYSTDTQSARLTTYLEAALSRAIPAVAEVAARIAAFAVPDAERAGLLVEAAAGTAAVLVIDEVEHLLDQPDAERVLESVLRYAPVDLAVVLISRHGLDRVVGGRGDAKITLALGEDDLAFTEAEATLLTGPDSGISMSDGELVRLTGGWVQPLSMARSSPATPTAELERDLLTYVWTQILTPLPASLRDFVLAGSVLEELSVDGAEAMGLPDAAANMHALYRYRLPGGWAPDGRSIRFHECFRRCLAIEHERTDAAGRAALRARLAHTLAGQGALPDAVELMLEIGELESALPLAEVAVEQIIERFDYAMADRWLDLLRDQGPSAASALTTGELMLAVAREEYGRGARIADQLEALGEREKLAEESPRAAAMMAWSYYHACRLDDVHAVLAATDESPATAAVEMLLTLVGDEPLTPGRDVDPDADPIMDGLFSRLDYWRGRPELAATAQHSNWAGAVSDPWRIAALRCTGRTADAYELYEQALQSSWGTASLHAVIGADLLIEMNREDEAFDSIRRGREMAIGSGSLVWEMFASLSEAKAELRLRDRPLRAAEILDDLEQNPAARLYASTAEQIDTWHGAAMLRLGRDRRALARLRAAVESMSRSERILELPTAAVYLAEACWRCGHFDEADRAADLALDATRKQRTKHTIMKALAEFPEVISRRIDSSVESETPWHIFARLVLGTSRAKQVTQSSSGVFVREFGALSIEVNRVTVTPRIKKSNELFALIAARGGSISRAQALSSLFDTDNRRSAQAYLRQAIHQLKVILPPECGLQADAETISLSGDIVIETESGTVETMIALASQQENHRRLRTLETMLEIAGRGDYAVGVHTEWAEIRRREIAAKVSESRYQAAELAYNLGLHTRSKELVEITLAEDPLREPAWRLRMRLASAFGLDELVLESYARCEDALAAIDAAPAPSTRRLLSQLRL